MKTAILVDAVQRLSLVKTLDEITAITRHAARELVGADGATFVLKDEDRCYYVDEEAIGPLWKGKRFPLQSCISGWAMIHRQSVVIEDVYKDSRIPIVAYRPTFVKSVVMTPIRSAEPIGAIGTYWAKNHIPTEEELQLLKALANSTSVALEHIQLLSDLKRTNTALQDALRSRDEFLSIASHELRTPLTALTLQLQHAQRKLSTDHDEVYPLFQKSIDVSVRQAAVLKYLVEQLLDISRIRLGELQLSYRPTSFSQVIREVVELLGPTLKNAGCEVEFNLDDSITGEWDQLRLAQIITNLISNACKYASNKPMKLSTFIDTNGAAVFQIEDQGIGISADAQKRIFDRFEREIKATEISGVGLGLYITKSLVSAHKGYIQVKSELGKGSTFIVELPLKALAGSYPSREAVIQSVNSGV